MKYKLVECRCLSSLFIIIVQIPDSILTLYLHVAGNLLMLCEETHTGSSEKPHFTNKLEGVQKEYRKKNKKRTLIGENKNESQNRECF